MLARPRSNSTYGPGDTYLPTTYLLGGDKLRVHSLTSSAFCTIFNGDAPDFLAQTNPSKSKRANDDHLPNTQPLRNITTEHSSFLSCSDFPFSLVATSDLLLFLPCDRRTGHFCRSSSREQEGDQTPGQQPRLNRHPLGHCELTGRIFSASPIRLIRACPSFGNRTSEQDDRPPVHSTYPAAPCDLFRKAAHLLFPQTSDNTISLSGKKIQVGLIAATPQDGCKETTTRSRQVLQKGR